MEQNFLAQRQQLVAALRKEGISDAQVLAAFSSVPREHFVSEQARAQSYADRALPLTLGQTISQPLMVALMTQALRLTGQERVLEVGTGSGYQTALLARLAMYVYSVERHRELAYLAAQHLIELRIHNVSIYVADGSLGWPDEAPYERIIVTAAAPVIPPQLLEQLCIGGLLVIPVGKQDQQELQVVERRERDVRVQSLGRCVFVPLVGQQGWQN